MTVPLVMPSTKSFVLEFKAWAFIVESISYASHATCFIHVLNMWEHLSLVNSVISLYDHRGRKTLAWCFFASLVFIDVRVPLLVSIPAATLTKGFPADLAHIWFLTSVY